MRILLAVLFVAVLFSGAAAQDDDEYKHGVLVELFTSQG